ncbi:polysaccharide pyruvyl transferase family protein [Methylophaga sp.]|uniref:polysaccharide pyruvyl transferase family protein n=1 Tax=Methylophaga sp. TaxID=2024840 RepID=UPI003A91590D
MNLFYEKMPGGNFGDDMNLWFWDSVIPKWRDYKKESVLFGIGTIINEGNFTNYKDIFVMGSGVGYGTLPLPESKRNINYVWVRGPKSAIALGLNEDLAITDPAILTPRFTIPSNVIKRKPIFIPHATTAKLPIKWDELCNSIGIEYVSPKDDSISVIERIRDAEYVIAESMHAAIIADAYRIPWIPVSISNQYNTFKWDDWASSLEMSVDTYEMLGFPKELYSKIKEFREITNKYFKFKSDKGIKKGINEKHIVEKNKGESERVKKLISKYEIVFEYLIKKGLRNSKSRMMMQSNISVYTRKIELIDEKIDLINRQISL